MGGVVGASTMMVCSGAGMLRCCRVAYLGQHLCRAQYLIFYGFTILKPMHIVFFQRVYVLLKGTLVVSSIALARRCQRRFRPTRDVLKKKVIIHIWVL